MQHIYTQKRDRVYTSQSFSSAQSVTVLPSMFNLVRTLHFLRYGGNLESINALLGCAVIIPKLPASIADFDIFEEYDDSTARNILNVYFYLINWFRETISAFASQDQQMIRKKVMYLYCSTNFKK